MSVLKECGKTFLKCFVAGSGQMIGMAAGMAGARLASQVIVEVIDKVKSRQLTTKEKPYHRMIVDNNDK